MYLDNYSTVPAYDLFKYVYDFSAIHYINFFFCNLCHFFYDVGENYYVSDASASVIYIVVFLL